MTECGTFTYQFSTNEQAKTVAMAIINWAKNELQECQWTEQLTKVTDNYLFVGNNAFMSWNDYDGKINKLASFLLQKFPGLAFSGEQSFLNFTTGFEVTEKFMCDGTKVTYIPVEKCIHCGVNIDLNNCYSMNDMLFCNEECAKTYLINYLMDEDDFDGDELEEKDCDELLNIWKDYH